MSVTYATLSPPSSPRNPPLQRLATPRSDRFQPLPRNPRAIREAQDRTTTQLINKSTRK